MSPSAIKSALASIAPGSRVSFSLGKIPFDELLLTLHMARFTGTITVGIAGEADRIFLREGAAVGVRPRPSMDRALLDESLRALKLVSTPLPDAPDGMALGQRLVDDGLLDAESVDRTFEEQARRRMFAIYDLDEEPVDVAEGLETLAHFHPVYVDVRPAIAFGMVVRSSPERKASMLDRVRGRSVRLIAPYDATRNGYGLPPPVLLALEDLADGVKLDSETTLPGLSARETAGVLLLFDRMSLLKID